MGYGGFQISHRSGGERYGRCVGKALPFAEIILVNPETGEEVPTGQVGMVAMKSPTLAIGYWNDSAATFRTRMNSYYLTGDLMYQDSGGYFYHMDRVSDAVDLGNGDWLYTALSEERILKACSDVRDCTILAVRGEDGGLRTEVLLILAPDADSELDRSAEVRAALGEVAAGLPLRIVSVPDDDIVVGPTGKVRKFLMRQQLLASAGTS
jgi:acyl-CoA synthetase (AMP-forming)/AMP-acid ligase II